MCTFTTLGTAPEPRPAERAYSTLVDLYCTCWRIDSGIFTEYRNGISTRGLGMSSFGMGMVGGAAFGESEEG